MIRLLGALCAVIVLSACTLTGPIATSSRGPVDAESGVGGTGFSDTSRDLDEGVGGTGISFTAVSSEGDDGVGGTGIFGIISAFGSIVVNGVHIDYEPETPVSVDGREGTPADFAIGQLVAVEADPMGERYQARLVEIQHAVVGPVSDVDVGARMITVLGQLVKVQPSDRLPEIGEWVRVSGLRDVDEHVVATRIDPALPAGDALVRGVVLPAEGDGLVLGRLRLAPDQMPGDAISAGDEILVRGRFGGQGFTVRDLSKAPVEPFGGRMRDLIIEGYLSPGVGDAGRARVAGHTWALPAALVGLSSVGRVDADDPKPLLFKGAWAGQELRVAPSHRYLLPELNGPLPWGLNDDQEVVPGSMPDLLRRPSGSRRGRQSAIDPTNLPDPDQLQAALMARGLPDAFLTVSHPLTADQLSAILALGGADFTADGPVTFDPGFLKVLIENSPRLEALSDGILLPAGDLDEIDAVVMQDVFQQLRDLGLPPSELQGQMSAEHLNPALLQVLARANLKLEHMGLDASTLPPQVLDHIQEIVRTSAAARAGAGR